jgi:Flp pilus assembly protein TadD
MRSPCLVLALTAVLLVGCGKNNKVDPAVPIPSTSEAPAVDPATPDVVETPEPEQPAGLTEDQLSRRVQDAVALLTVRDEPSARRALGILDQIAKRDTSNGYVFYNLGVAHAQLGEVDEAERAYRRATTLGDGMSKAWLGLGVLLEQEGRALDAVDSYRRGAEADEEDMEVRSALIGALRRAGKSEEAIAAAKAALAFNSKSLPVYNDLGLVYMQSGRLSLARFVYLKALGLDGGTNNAGIRCNFGWTLYQQGDHLQARRQLEEALAVDAKYLPTLVYLSHLYMDDRNYVDAVPLLEEALSQEPQNYGVLMNLGIAYRGTGKLAESRKMYDRALEAKPGAADPWLNIGVLQGDYYKDYETSIAAFSTYLEKGGSEADKVALYVNAVEKEQGRADKKKEQAKARAQRELERKDRERLLKEAEEKAQDGAGTPAPGEQPATPEGAGEQPATPEGAGDSEQPEQPWGEQ